MHGNLKAGEDSLVAFQHDIAQLALAVSSRLKKKKLSMKKKMESKKDEDKDGPNESHKLPSLYESSAKSSKQNMVGSLSSSVLLQRIQEFEKRITDLETESIIQKRQNKNLVDHIIRLRRNHQSLDDGIGLSSLHQPDIPHPIQTPSINSSQIYQMVSPLHQYGSQFMQRLSYKSDDHQNKPFFHEAKLQQIPRASNDFSLVRASRIQQMQRASNGGESLGSSKVQQGEKASKEWHQTLLIGPSKTHQVHRASNGSQSHQSLPLRPSKMQQVQRVQRVSNVSDLRHPSQLQQLPKKLRSTHKQSLKVFKRGPNKFRIVGYVVYFSIFFPRFATTFTLNRFNEFKTNWMVTAAVEDGRAELKEYFLTNIPFKMLENFAKLNESGKKQNKGRKQTKRSKGKKKKAKDDSDDSDDDSGKESDNQTEVHEFYLKVNVQVQFVVQFMKAASRLIEAAEFAGRHPYLGLLLPREFQADQLMDEADFKYQDLHMEKGYSQAERTTVEYLLVKSIFLNVFIEERGFTELGRSYYSKQKGGEELENEVNFNFFIREGLMKRMLQQYLSNKIEKAKESTLPREELLAVPKGEAKVSPFKNGAFSFTVNGAEMDEAGILEVSAPEIEAREEEVRDLLNGVSSRLYSQLVELRRKRYEDLMTRTVSQKYRTENNSYFELHSKFERQKLMRANLSVAFHPGSVGSEKSETNHRYPNRKTTKNLTKTSKSSKKMK